MLRRPGITDDSQGIYSFSWWLHRGSETAQLAEEDAPAAEETAADDPAEPAAEEPPELRNLRSASIRM